MRAVDAAMHNPSFERDAAEAGEFLNFTFQRLLFKLMTDR